MALPSPRGTNFHSRSEHPPERRGRRRQPEGCSPSPARLGGGTCTQEAPVPWSISAPPLSSCGTEEAVWEPGAAGGGQRGRAGCSVCSVQSQQLFVVESQRLTRRGQRRRRLLSNRFPRLWACNPPLPLSPRLSQHNPFWPRLRERAPSLNPHPHPSPAPSRGNRQMLCACVTQLLSTHQQVTQAPCPAPCSSRSL